jgi:hypothetical protein
VAVLGTVLWAAPAAGAGAPTGWGKPFRLAPPYSTDLLPASIAFAPSGEAAVGFGAQDQDNSAVSQGYLTLGTSAGKFGSTRAVPGAQRVLDLAYAGRGLVLLIGTSPSGYACCSTAQTLAVARGQFGPARTLVDTLTGATVGSLTRLPSGKLLAAVGGERGVWVTQSRTWNDFGPIRRLTSAAAMPWTLAVTADRRGRTVVAWTQTRGQQGQIAPNQIVAAGGSESGAPRRGVPAVTVAAGHQVDEIGLAPASSGATAAWIESWFDRAGAYHSEVVVSDLGSGGRRQVFAAAGQAASGLAVAGGGNGDQAVAWRSCTAGGSCTLRAAVRPRGGRFGSAQSLGAVDPGQGPAAAVAPSGEALVGWISGGHVLAAERHGGAGRLGSARTVSSTSFAADLTIAFAGSHQALAAWTQGTLAPDVVGAVFRAG